MLTKQRQELILKALEIQGSVTVQEMMKELEASESTIRRDIIALDKAGKLVKVFGGAVANQNFLSRDDAVETREGQNKEAKLAIGKYAASMIKSGDFVYLDAGTTIGCMLEYITDQDAVFVTNAVVHAQRLAHKGKKVYLLGGEFKSATEAIIGSEAMLGLKKYHFNIGFFGTNGLSVETGCTTPDPNEALVKQTALEHSMEKVILCDHTKFNRISPVSFCGFEDAVIVTDFAEDKMAEKHENIIEVRRKE